VAAGGAKKTEKPKEPRAFSPSSLAKHWGCSAEHVRAMIRQGKVQAFRLGKLYRITPEEVARWDEAGFAKRTEL
jgi:excisionase family DNA binding protein